MRGSKPTPTELKELQGTLQPCRTNPLEPKLKKKIENDTAPPEYLSERAKVHWRFVIANEGTFWLKQCDRAMLEQYCEIWAELIAAREEKKEVLKELATARKNLAEMISCQAMEAARAWAKERDRLEDRERYLSNLIVKTTQPFKAVASELGLTPSSRSRVMATGEEHGNVDNKTLSLFGDDAIDECLEGLNYEGMMT